MGKPGMITMFVGAVLVAIMLFGNFNISFGVWVTLFLISMLVAATGAVLSIIELAKKIKLEKMNK